MNISKRESLTRLELTDFLVEMIEYLDSKNPIRLRGQKIIEDIGNDQEVSTEALKSVVEEVARASWSPRMALSAFLKTPEGSQAEWKGVVAAVRNSTEHVLERFKAGTNVGSIDELLVHAESNMALKESERTEIREVRTHLLPYLWHTHKKKLEDELKRAEETLKQIDTRLKSLREMATEDSINGKQILNKVAQYEAEMFGEGKVIDVEQLDDEIVFFHEMKPEI